MGYTMSFTKADNGMNFPASRDHNKSGEGECKPKTAEVLYCNFKPVGQAWSLFQARMNLRLMISLPGRRHPGFMLGVVDGVLMRMLRASLCIFHPKIECYTAYNYYCINNFKTCHFRFPFCLS